jgi:xanthine dehydrogenase YagR molybdenum-binding subunit
MTLAIRAIGAGLDRLDGREKVQGAAIYAFEHPVDRPAYLHPVQATVATGRTTAVDTSAAGSLPGVLAVLTHTSAPRLAAPAVPELAILQSDQVHYRGQFVGAVVAETPEIARQAAGLVRVEYAPGPHDVELRADRPDLYAPDQVTGGFPTDTAEGDIDAALATAAVRIDETYSTAMYHNNPMEPHSTIAIWDGSNLTVYLSTQGVHRARTMLAQTLGLDPTRVRLISPHVGGAFGSKVSLHSDAVLAALAARRLPGRPVKLALTRQQMFSLVGYRTPTIQRIRLGAGSDGRLTAVEHNVVEQTAKIQEFAEQTAVPSRTMYASPNRRTTHRLAALDVPPPNIMRAPGEAPGMFAVESAMDEMAIACGLDPIEFRIRNEPTTEPESGLPFSSRNLVGCLREGARRFGWDRRDPAPRSRSENGWLVGVGVAASTYPVFHRPGESRATIRVGPAGRYTVRIGAADMGTGTWTALTQIAADALGVGVAEIELQIGDTAWPMAVSAGGSAGLSSWGWAIVEAAGQLRRELESEYGGRVPPGGLEVTATQPDNPHRHRYGMHSFGAQFAEVRVREDSGEVRVPRLLGVFAAGRIVNAKTGRSQLLGGMTMGLSMALHEQSVFDSRIGQVANQDFAEYHISVNADVGSVEVRFLPEDDPYVNPFGAKGIGELGIVGTAAAVANAVHHATGIRVRDLPITLDKLLT